MKHKLLAYESEDGQVRVGILDTAVYVGQKTIAYICNIEGEIEQVPEERVLDWQKEGVA